MRIKALIVLFAALLTPVCAMAQDARLKRSSKKALSFLCYLTLSALAPSATTIVLGTSSPCEAAGEPKRVMMLHSFGPLFKPWSEHAQTVRSEITRQLQSAVDFQDHSIVSARANNEQSEGPFVDYLDALYAEHPLDLIVAIGAPAANFVQRHRQRLFPRTPMIFTSVEKRRVENDKLTEYDTVVAIANDFRAVVEDILRVLPLTKTIAIVTGASPNERFWTEEIRRELAPLAGRLELKWYNELSFEDILKEAAKLPPHSAIFWGLMNVDAAGVVHEASTALNRLSSSTNAPIFSYIDAFFGEGIVGGPMHAVAETSKRTAAVAVRILNGEKAGDIKTPPTTFASSKFDWRQMQRWGISESNLPPGSEIHFREPSLWEKYRWQSISVVVALLLQAALIAFLLHEKKKRHDAEIEARHRMSELAHVNRSSTAGELSSSIAHELNQPLGSILTNTETAELILRGQSPDLNEVSEILADIRRDDLRANEVLRRLRSFVKRTPFETKDIDLNVLMREVFDFLSVQASARNVALYMTHWSQPLWIKGDPIHLQQVVINLIVNSMDAMAAMPYGRTVMGRTETNGGTSALMSISDSGPGIPVEQFSQVFDPLYTTKEQGMGIGLSIARTIILAHQGQIWAENQAEGGAVFRISLPLSAT
jgi:signal transduction histidine kinase/ABC-type uncharacterized transport system substrate-binding protein